MPEPIAQGGHGPWFHMHNTCCSGNRGSDTAIFDVAQVACRLEVPVIVTAA